MKMKAIEMPATVLEEMIEHAREGHPCEVCGIIAGKDFADSHIYRMTNTENSPVSYFMDPTEQFQVMKDIRKREEKMLAIYHSHPDSEAYPSAKDVSLAFYPDSLYIIVSLMRQEPVVRAFSIVDGEVEEISITPL